MKNYKQRIETVRSRIEQREGICLPFIWLVAFAMCWAPVLSIGELHDKSVHGNGCWPYADRRSVDRSYRADDSGRKRNRKSKGLKRCQ